MAKKKRHKISNCGCLNLRMAARTITQFYDSRFKEIGLRSTQFNVLAAIEEAGPVAMTRLADTLVMDRTTLNRDLQPLQRDGLVSIQKGEDKRVRLIDLTDEGRVRLERGLPVWKALQDGFYASMGKEGWKALQKSLSKTTRIAQKKTARG
jgi:DNA-binding MarR family transcriptional regulator